MSASTSSRELGDELRAGDSPLVELTQDPEFGIPDNERNAILIWVCSIAVLMATIAYFSMQLDWQTLSPTVSCAHCIAVHKTLGSLGLICDTSSLSSLFFVGLLPFFAAAKFEYFQFDKLLQIAPILFAMVLLPLLVGTISSLLVNLVTVRRFEFRKSISNYLVGVRILSAIVGIYATLGGFSTESIVGQFQNFTGAYLGEKLVAAIGVTPISNALLVCFLSSLTSLLIRWFLPFLMRSRPIAFLKSNAPLHLGKRRMA